MSSLHDLPVTLWCRLLHFHLASSCCCFQMLSELHQPTRAGSSPALESSTELQPEQGMKHQTSRAGAKPVARPRCSLH